MFEVERVHVCLKNEFQDIDFVLYHNVNIVTGKSGAGKSYIVSSLLENMEDVSIVAKDSAGNEIPIKVSINQFSVPTAEALLTDNYFVILDDMPDDTCANVISNVLKRNTNSVFLIITRDSMEFEDLSNLACFSEAVYNVRLNESKLGDKLRLEQMCCSDLYSVAMQSEEYCGKYDCCVVEGEGGKAEYTLFSYAFNCVQDCQGKSHVIRKLSNLIKDTNEPILVCVDMCAFGVYLEEFVKEFADKNVTLCEYYSLESSLVLALDKTNDYRNICSDFIDGITFERYFSNKLIGMRVAVCGKFSKTSLPLWLQAECVDICGDKYQYMKDKCNLYGTTAKERILNIFKEALPEVYYASRIEQEGNVYAKRIVRKIKYNRRYKQKYEVDTEENGF